MTVPTEISIGEGGGKIASIRDRYLAATQSKDWSVHSSTSVKRSVPPTPSRFRRSSSNPITSPSPYVKSVKKTFVSTRNVKDDSSGGDTETTTPTSSPDGNVVVSNRLSRMNSPGQTTPKGSNRSIMEIPATPKTPVVNREEIIIKSENYRSLQVPSAPEKTHLEATPKRVSSEVGSVSSSSFVSNGRKNMELARNALQRELEESRSKSKSDAGSFAGSSSARSKQSEATRALTRELLQDAKRTLSLEKFSEEEVLEEAKQTLADKKRQEAHKTLAPSHNSRERVSFASRASLSVESSESPVKDASMEKTPTSSTIKTPTPKEEEKAILVLGETAVALKKSLRVKSKKVDELESEVSQLKKTLQAREGEKQVLNKELHAMSQSLMGANSEAEKLRGQAESTRHENEYMEREQAKSAQVIASLKEALKAKSGEIESFNLERKEREKEITELRTTVTNKSKKIVSLEVDLESHDTLYFLTMQKYIEMLSPENTSKARVVDDASITGALGKIDERGTADEEKSKGKTRKGFFGRRKKRADPTEKTSDVPSPSSGKLLGIASVDAETTIELLRSEQRRLQAKYKQHKHRSNVAYKGLIAQVEDHLMEITSLERRVNELIGHDKAKSREQKQFRSSEVKKLQARLVAIEAERNMQKKLIESLKRCVGNLDDTPRQQSGLRLEVNNGVKREAVELKILHEDNYVKDAKIADLKQKVKNLKMRLKSKSPEEACDESCSVDFGSVAQGSITQRSLISDRSIGQSTLSTTWTK